MTPEERAIRARIVKDIEAVVIAAHVHWCACARPTGAQLADRTGWEAGMHQAARVAAGGVSA